MHILQVCPYDLTRTGGVQRHILDLAGALARAGHAVTVVAAAPRERAELPSPAPRARAFEVVHLGRCRAWRMHGTAFELTWVRSAALHEFRRALAQPIDVVHFHSMHVPFMPWRLMRVLDGAPARRIATFHDTPPPGVSGRLACHVFGFMSRRLSRHLDAIIPVSQSAGAHLRPLRRCPVVSLPPCIDLTPYQSLTRQRRDETAPVALFVGRIEPRKGVLLLIDAFARVRAAYPQARLIVCGDGEQRNAAQARAAAAGIADAVTFKGAVSDAEKLSLYREADVFCAPSPYGESYGLVVAEAMAAGLPVVAAANAGYGALLKGGGEAGLVAPADASALADGIARVLASRELRSSLSAWGRGAAPQSDVTTRLGDFLAVYSGSERK